MDEKDEILVIDDDEGTRKTLALILKKKGFDVITAGTGEDGLKQAKGRKIAVALLDINLPDIEGIRLIAPLKEITPDLAVIMITGFASMENAMRALNEGAAGYVLKPVKIDEILSKIHDALERQRLIKSKQQAEEALRLSEEKYRSLVENINDVIYSLDEQGVITYISPAIEKISGYPPSHLTGHPFAGFIVKEDLPGVMQAFEAGMKGTITSFPFRIITKSGDQRWLSNSSYPAFTKGNLTGVHGVLSDITERKRAEEALWESREHYRAFIDHSQLAIAVLDVNFKIIMVNARFSELFKKPVEDFVGKYCFNEFEKRTAVCTHCPGARAMVSGKSEEIETVGMLDDGSCFSAHNRAVPFFGPDGVLKGFVEMVEDVTERKRAEEALRNSEERFRTMIEQSPLSIEVMSPDGRTVQVNPAFVKLWGVTLEDLKDYNMLKDEQLISLGIMPYIQRGFSGEAVAYPPLEYDGAKTLGHGDKRWVQGSIYPVRDTAGTIRNVILVHEDISEQKKAEEALRESEEKFRDIFNNANDAIEIVELLDNGLPGGYLDLNDVACRMLLYSREEMLRLGPLDINTDSFSRPFDEVMRELHTTGHAIFETEHRRKDRVIVPVEVNSHKITLMGKTVLLSIARDITERKKAETAIQQSEQKFRDIFNNTTDAIHIHGIGDDGIPGRFTDVNDVTWRMLGYTKEELLTKTPLDIATDYHNPPIEKILEEQRTAGSARFETEYRRKDGTVIPVEINTHVVIIQGIKVMLGVVRDITERKKAEALMKHFNEELEQEVKVRTEELSASLDEKVILLREIHHRVRNNFQIILSLLSLQSRSIGDEKFSRAMRESQNRIRAMAFVHETLYTSADFAQIDLESYVKYLTTQLFTFFKVRPGTISLILDVKNIFIDINTAIPLGLVINELVSNSLKHAFPGGRKGQITISIHDNQKGLTLTYQDNGVGFSEGFDWQTTESLGFRLIRVLIDQLDGTIEQEPAKGTLFTIRVMRKTDEQGDIYGTFNRVPE